MHRTHRAALKGVIHAHFQGACSGIKRVLGLWSWRGRGFQRGRRLKFAAGRRSCS
jgi:hypothetical protein